jgi:fructokinase
MPGQAAEFAIGIDLGGTKIACVVLGPENETVWKQRVPTPSGDYAGILKAIAALVSEAHLACEGKAPDRLGIGIPGELASDGRTVKNANSTCLIGNPLGHDIEAHLGMRVQIANDANCFALSEAIDGAGIGEALVFGVIIGTGVGGGITIHQKMWVGRNRLSGEWGHNPFPLLGVTAKQRECYCGRKDCNETWLSGPALSRNYLERTGERIAAMEIAARAKAGEAAAHAILDEYATHLAMGLSSVVNLLDPDVIVLGGGLSNLDDLYEILPERLSGFVFNATDAPVNLQTRIVKNKWGDDSGVRGAAFLSRQM